MQTDSKQSFNPTIDRIFEAANRLHALPTNAARIRRMLADPYTTEGIVIDLIALDQVLAAQVLRVANTEWRGKQPPSASIPAAAQYVGLERIKTIIDSAISADAPADRLSGYGLEAEELWRHSVVVASAARLVGGAVKYPDLDEAYTAGLLHDIGKLVLDPYVQGRHDELTRLINDQQLELWQAEEQLFRMDHGTIGSLIIDRWHCPEALSEAVRYHHWPAFASVRPALSAIINVSNALAVYQSQMQLGDPTLQPEALEILQLDHLQIRRLQTLLYEQFAKA